MSLGDWIRELNARQRERLLRRARVEGYLIGYADAQAGRPSRYQEQESDCNGVTE